MHRMPRRGDPARFAAAPLAGVVFVAWAAAACATPAPYVWASRVSARADEGRPQRIERGDKISVAVAEHPELSGQYVVAPDGSFLQPLAGSMPVAGHNVDDASKLLANRLTPYLTSPSVTISVIELRPVRVNIFGEVKTGGSYELRHGEGMLSVLARAGGFSEFADQDSIYLIRATADTPRIRFRYAELVDTRSKQAAFPLLDGDTIVVE